MVERSGYAVERNQGDHEKEGVDQQFLAGVQAEDEKVCRVAEVHQGRVHGLKKTIEPREGQAVITPGIIYAHPA